MQIFPDEPAKGAWSKCAVAILPLFYLVIALVYSAHSAPWGSHVDPESAYAMNGLAWAAGYPMIKNDHPGTTTILLAGLVTKAYALASGQRDVVEFGLKNYDAMIYAVRGAEALVLALALFAGGMIVRKSARSAVAAMLFQVSPFVNFEAIKYDMRLVPESLMIASGLFGMALVVKAALDEKPPTVGLGVAQGVTFALGLSSKYLYAPVGVLVVALLRSRRATVAAIVTAALLFFAFNRILNPYVFTSGFRWLVSLATHKGIYGEGEAGFIDFNLFWPNVAKIITADPIVVVVFVTGAAAALLQISRTRRYLDPVSLTLLAAFAVFAALVVATAKHFQPHYTLAAWTLIGGVLVLTFIELRRLWPALPSGWLAAASSALCLVLIASTLIHARNDAVAWGRLNRIGDRLSRAVIAAAPTCANVSGMFVRAPENHLNHGGDMTLATPQMENRFSDAYARVFDVPLLDHSFYRNGLFKNFHEYSYAKLAAEYPCVVVRVSQPLDAKSSAGLLELKPDHCIVEGIHIYTLGIACTKIRDGYASELAADSGR
ncbi:MAG: hypothetical protein GY844_25010 [Bradyrhizobium sp.]|nr:hypothetical protein [Bradyrhizobium sp.]